MKIKHSFVTNSSSTSFIFLFNVDSKYDNGSFLVNVLGSDKNRPPLILNLFDYVSCQKILNKKDLDDLGMFSSRKKDQLIKDYLDNGKILYVIHLDIDDDATSSDPMDLLVAGINWIDHNVIIDKNIEYVGDLG